MAAAQQHLLVEQRPIAERHALAAGLPANARLAEIPSLAGLRAFAAIVVVLCHVVSPSIPGRYAVALFFALSGFLITTLLLRERAATGRINIRAFYIRRARRLLPAYYAWLVAVVLLMSGRITPEIGAAALYLSDYYTAWIRQGQILHTWSLSVEEHFYLLWPPALLAWSKTKSFIPAVATLIFIVEAARFVWGVTYSLYFSYSFEAKVDALLLGCLLAIWTANGGTLPKVLAGRWSWLLSVAGLVFCACLPDVQIRAVGETAVVWLSVLLIAQVVASPPAILNNPVTDYLGARSYSLYLYHVLVRAVYMALVPGSKGMNFNVHGPANQIAVILLSIGAASLSYRYIERPFRGRNPLRARLAVQ